MTPLKHPIYAWFTALLLLHAAQLPASPQNQVNQLKAELEKIQSETQAITEQTRTNKAKIEQLKNRIKRLQIENKTLDQRILREIKLNEDKNHTISNEDK